MKIMVLEFLKYAYFNITKGDDMNDILSKCANKAYMDLCRTIKFKTVDGNIKAEYKAKICDMLVNEYNALLVPLKMKSKKFSIKSTTESAKKSSKHILKSVILHTVRRRSG